MQIQLKEFTNKFNHEALTPFLSSFLPLFLPSESGKKRKGIWQQVLYERIS